MADNKDGNLNKKPEEMSLEELENHIKTVTAEVEQPTITEEPKKEEEPKGEQKQEQGKEEQGQEQKQEEKQVAQDLILGKFKTQEDVIKAYPEAEKKISEQGAELGQLRKQKELYQKYLEQNYILDETGNVLGIKPELTRIQPPPQQMPKQDMISAVKQAYPALADVDDSVVESIVGISGEIAKYAIQQEASRYKKEFEPLYELTFERAVEKQKKEARQSFSDFAQFEEEIDGQLNTMPPELRGKKGAVETLYYITKGRKSDEIANKKVSEAQKQIGAINSKKDDAFVETSSKGSVGTPPINPAKMPLDELEDYIKKHPEYGK